MSAAGVTCDQRTEVMRVRGPAKLNVKLNHVVPSASLRLLRDNARDGRDELVAVGAGRGPDLRSRTGRGPGAGRGRGVGEAEGEGPNRSIRDGRWVTTTHR